MPSSPAGHLIDVEALESLSHRELEARAKALRTINAIADMLLAAGDARDVLGPAIEALARFTRFPAITLYGVNESAQRLDLLCSRGLSEATLRSALVLPLEGSLTGMAVRRREIVLSPDVTRDVQVEPTMRQRLGEEGFSATVSVPLLVGERAVGAMNLIYKGEAGFTEYEGSMLSSVGKAMALAIERVRCVRWIDKERQRSDATLRSIGDGIIATDDRGNVTTMNREAERLTAWPQSEALGRPIEQIFRICDAKTREPLESPVIRSLRQRVRLSSSAVLLARDDTEREIIGTSAPILDGDGDAWGAVLAFQDVTHARRDHNWLAFMHDASQLLARSFDYETTLAQVARLAVASLADYCTVDVVQADGSIRRLAGAHTDPAKQPLVDAVVKISHLDPNAPEGVPRAIRTRQPVLYDLSREEVQLLGMSYFAGSQAPEYLRALSALDLSSGLVVPLIVGHRTLGAICLASRGPHRFKVSDVERAEQLSHCFALAIENARLHREVKDALAMREEFINLAAHELKTPLTALQLDLAALEKAHRGSGDAAMVTKVARAVRQCKRLVRTTESVIDVSVLCSGCIALHLREIDLRRLLANSAELCREEAERARCVIELGAGPAVLWRCDERRIEQAVCSLLTNAIKYGKGRPIELVVEASGDAMARISVTDHGIGIAREERARIFEPFERAVSSRHYGGLGLGLYVARESVQAHGGAILVASEPEVGSTFTILLPASLPA